MQELNCHPQQLKWIASIKRLDDLSILTGRTKLRSVLMDAKLQFDLCLMKTPPNENARSTLSLIRELVCLVVDSKHWVRHIKAQSRRLVSLEFIHGPLENSLKTCVYTEVKAIC